MKNFVKKLVSLILFLIYSAAFLLAGKYIWDVYFAGNMEAEQDLMVLKKIQYKIIIPYTYSYTNSKRFIDYVKDEKTNKMKVVQLAEKRIDKEYDSNMKKQDKLYDTFLVNKTWRRYDVNLKEMWRYNFEALVESFSTAPYYDTKNKSLYVFSHSSGKWFNPWADYFDIKEWDSLEFLDYDTQILDTYEVESRNIVSKWEFFDSIFTTIEDRIVLVTCYPLNSTAKRLYVVLKKKSQ